MNENMTVENSPMESARPGSKMNVLAVVGIVAVVAILGFVIMQGNSKKTAPAEQTKVEINQTETTQPALSDDGETMTTTSEESMVALTMEAGSFYFNPETITVKKGQTVRIELTAVDMMHNFTLDEFGIESEVVPAGESVTVEFVADTVGEFEYYCNVSNHRARGQVGRLIVEE